MSARERKQERAMPAEAGTGPRSTTRHPVAKPAALVERKLAGLPLTPQAAVLGGQMRGMSWAEFYDDHVARQWQGMSPRQRSALVARAGQVILPAADWSDISATQKRALILALHPRAARQIETD